MPLRALRFSRKRRREALEEVLKLERKAKVSKLKELAEAFRDAACASERFVSEAKAAK